MSNQHKHHDNTPAYNYYKYSYLKRVFFSLISNSYVEEPKNASKGLLAAGATKKILNMEHGALHQAPNPSSTRPQNYRVK